MIDLVRVDNRLIHGQVVEGWVPFVKARRIVVVDDEAASDPLKRSILELAAPASIHLEILTVAQVAAAFSRLQDDGEHTVVLFSGPTQAFTAYKAGFIFRSLNVGNVHYSTGKTRVTQSVCCNDEELSVLRELARAGVEIELRAVPREAARFITPDGEARSR